MRDRVAWTGPRQARTGAAPASCGTAAARAAPWRSALACTAVRLVRRGCAALAPGVLATFWTVDVTADEDTVVVWSATVTAEATTAPTDPWVGYFGVSSSSHGQITDDTIDWRGGEYSVYGIHTKQSQGLRFVLRLAPGEFENAGDLTLHVDGHALALADASWVSQDTYTYHWNQPGFSWSDGQTASVSLTASATDAVAPDEPGPPQNVDVRSVNRHVRVSWDRHPRAGASAVTSYRVQWRSGSQEYDTSRQLVIRSKSLMFTGLEYWVEYTFRVTTTNSHGTSLPSEEVTIIPRDVLALFHQRIDDFVGRYGAPIRG